MKKLYAIYDKLLTVYHAPLVFRSDAEALRTFRILSEDKSTQIGSSPEDYCMCYLGEMDETTGELKAPELPKILK